MHGNQHNLDRSYIDVTGCHTEVNEHGRFIICPNGTVVLPPGTYDGIMHHIKHIMKSKITILSDKNIMGMKIQNQVVSHSILPLTNPYPIQPVGQ